MQRDIREGGLNRSHHVGKKGAGIVILFIQRDPAPGASLASSHMLASVLLPYPVGAVSMSAPGADCFPDVQSDSVRGSRSAETGGR